MLEIQLLIQHEQKANRWTDIAAHLHIASNNDVKNYFYNCTKKQIKNIIDGVYPIDNHVDILRSYYHSKMLVEAIQSPTPKSNYLKTLLEVNKKKVVEQGLIYSYINNFKRLFVVFAHRSWTELAHDFVNYSLGHVGCVFPSRIAPKIVFPKTEVSMSIDERAEYAEIWTKTKGSFPQP